MKHLSLLLSIINFAPRQVESLSSIVQARYHCIFLCIIVLVCIEILSIHSFLDVSHLAILFHGSSLGDLLVKRILVCLLQSDLLESQLLVIVGLFCRQLVTPLRLL